MKRTILSTLVLFFPFRETFAQTVPNPEINQWWSSPGIIGTALLIAVVSFVAILIIGSRLSAFIQGLQNHSEKREKEELKSQLVNWEEEDLDWVLEKRKAAKKI